MDQWDASAVRERLAANIAAVRQRMAAACARAGRDPAAVRLVAVTKSVGTEALRAVLDAGVHDLGENRVQQLAGRAAELARAVAGSSASGSTDAPTRPSSAAAAPTAASTGAPSGAAGSAERGAGPRPCWHFIGHLQRNKIRALLPWADVIHSIDSVRLADAAEGEAARLGRTVDVFLQINVAGEQQKYGAPPGEAAMLAGHIERLPHLRLTGLMTMAPWFDDPQDARPVFSELRRLLDRLRASGAAGPGCIELSMGMSGDFEVAIEEGATVVRVGTALFTGLPTGTPS